MTGTPLTEFPLTYKRTKSRVLMQALSLADQFHLLDNGYEPIPLNGKAAVALAWQSGALTKDRIIAMREAYPTAENVGLRTGKLVVVDIDIPDSQKANAIINLAESVLCATRLHRFGSKGMVLLYRTEFPLRKISVLTGQADKIEILGYGLQVAAFGIHPQTDKEFAWIKQTEFEEPATPLTVPLDTLPA